MVSSTLDGQQMPKANFTPQFLDGIGSLLESKGFILG